MRHVLAYALAVIIYGGFLIIAVGLIANRGAHGHEWYPPLCCSGGDCGPLAADRVAVEGSEYVIDHRWRIPITSATPSPDGQFHGCWPDKDKPPVCFYAPPNGS